MAHHHPVYFARTTREGKRWLAEFPDAPGCQTFADTREALFGEAVEALEGWLEAHLENGRVPPRPKARRGEGFVVDVDPKLMLAMTLRWERHDRGLTQRDLARLAHVSQQQIAKLESREANPSIETLEKIGGALQLLPVVAFVSARTSSTRTPFRVFRKSAASRGFANRRHRESAAHLRSSAGGVRAYGMPAATSSCGSPPADSCRLPAMAIVAS
jgi:transcriptional regulator with XRE-family HTH domain/predicted RNase H-like HicB family nuclease